MGKKKSATRMGRPPKPPGEQRDVLLQIRMTAAERAAIKGAAAGQMSTWARETLLRAAKKAKKNALE